MIRFLLNAMRQLPKGDTETAMRIVSSHTRTFSNTGLLTLVRLKQDECRWPVSHNTKALGGYLFCGRQTHGHSYCTKHQLLNRSTRKS